MSLDFLQSIARSSFPLRLQDQHAIECVHVLRAAELVDAVIEYGDRPGTYQGAVVHGITREGRAALARAASNKPLA